MKTPMKKPATFLGFLAGAFLTAAFVVSPASADNGKPGPYLLKDGRNYTQIADRNGDYSHRRHREKNFSYGNKLHDRNGHKQGLHKGQLSHRDRHKDRRHDRHSYKDRNRHSDAHRHHRHSGHRDRHGHRDHYRYGYGGKVIHNGLYKDKSPYSYGHGHSKHHYYKKHQYGYGCRKVSDIKYWYGRKAHVGGTGCFDRYGAFYIVPGSRYLISYLYY